jgi:hypothetical protein
MKERENILAELNELTLSELAKGFASKHAHIDVPADYFTYLPDQVITEIHVAKSKSVPSFDDMPKDYFGTMQKEVLSKVNLTSLKPTKKIVNMTPWYKAAAAVMIGVFSVSTMYFYNNNTTAPSQIASTINTTEFSEEEVTYIIDQYSSDLDLQNLDPSHVENLSTSDEDMQLMEDILSDEEINQLNEIM